MRKTIVSGRRPALVNALTAAVAFALGMSGACADDTGEPGAVTDDAAVGADAGADGAGVSDGTDGVVDTRLSDVNYITEIPENVDVAFLFDIPPDAGAPDGAVDTAGGSGDASVTDVDLDAAEAGPTDAWNPGFDTLLTECESIGIAESWDGFFQGEIAFDIDTGGALDPAMETGVMPVGGTLGFSIVCIESKLVVNGTLSGIASIQDQGDFPFTLSLQGYYSPSQKKLSAQFVDGEVSIYGLLSVYFIGALTGDLLDDGTFTGAWNAEATGTNTPAITGIADGLGTWTASETAAP